jgi:alpha-tubulin suppressor-like RCC1 family protein
MLNSQNLINKICSKIACGGLTSLQTCQTTGALSILSNPVVSVESFINLPDPVVYSGRMIYVNDENKYYYALESIWVSDFKSNPVDIASPGFAWGNNSIGQLGTGNTVSRSSPVSVVGGFTDWCQFSAGRQHSLGVRTNGTAWAWGCNNFGILGDNTQVSRSSPVSVAGGFTDWCQVSAGCLHSLGVRTNGTAWAWGYNGGGRLGDNTVTIKISPVSVVGGFTDWCQVSAGCQHSLGVRSNCTAWAWGCNLSGRLGDNSAVNKSSPVSVAGGFTDWCQVSTSHQHSLGMRTNGTAWAWGFNNVGMLGDNSTTSRSSPVSVVGGFTDWCQISAGYSHSLGVRTNGTAWAWGCNAFGNLGDNCTTNRSSPVSVVGGFTDWCQISAGAYSSIGVRTNGTAWAWGSNNTGRLGDNSTTNRSSPVSVVGGFTSWCQVSIYTFSLGILQISKGF